jgi:endonuclease/exonuclease/phosphatase (EEP) superfamily protein YafD
MLRIGSSLLATPFVAWAVARLFGLERGFPAVQLIAFTPYMAGAGVIVAVALLAVRQWTAGAAAAVAAIALVAVIVPRALADGGPTPDGPRLRMLTANLLAGSGDERVIADLVRTLDIDLLAVQELTPDDVAGLEAAGVGGSLPHKAVYPQVGVVGSGLFSRHPLGATGLRVHASGVTQAKATVLVPDGPSVAVESVHPDAPEGPGRPTTRWKRDLASEPPADPGGPIRILAGDFNATLDHAALRRLIDTGYRDCAATVGAGIAPTWPYDEKWYIPGVTLDRILVDRRVGVRAARTYRIPGSDHKAFYAELALPAT